MENEEALKRLNKFKDDVYPISFFSKGNHKNGMEFNFDDIDKPLVANRIVEDGGFEVKGLNTGDFTGDYWVRLSCGFLNKPILDSDCNLIAELDAEKDLENTELDVLDTIDKNVTAYLCEGAKNRSLCEKSVSMGLMTQLGENFSESIRESIEHELNTYFDYIEFKDKENEFIEG